MPQPFYSRKHELKVGPRKGETVYSAQPYYYGVISTRQMATQIAEESSLTRADVIAVIDRLVYYCKTHVMLGYKIRFDGLGTFYNEFVTTGTVNSPDEVTAKLVKAILEGEADACAALMAPIQKDMDETDARRKDLHKSQEGKKADEIPVAEKDELAELDKKWEALKGQKEAILQDYASKNKVIRQLIDLALLQNGMLKGEALNNFLKRSVELINE